MGEGEMGERERDVVREREWTHALPSSHIKVIIRDKGNSLCFTITSFTGNNLSAMFLD